MTEASIVICTYNRPALLPKAVSSCTKQRGDVRFEIIVVDNSRDGNARARVTELAARDARINYVAATTPNISHARNKGIFAARGDLVAFLDDDAEAEPGWLQALVGTIGGTGADCAYGPVLPRFEGGRPPSWDPEGWWFTRTSDLPDGTDYRTAISGRRNRAWIGACNSILRRSTCVVDNPPFDPAFGATGGEDALFFRGVLERGGRIVWCGSAEVYEWMPAERQTLDYQISRYRHACRVLRTVDGRLQKQGRMRALGDSALSLARVSAWGPLRWLTKANSRLGTRARFGFARGAAGLERGVPAAQYGELGHPVTASPTKADS